MKCVLTVFLTILVIASAWTDLKDLSLFEGNSLQPQRMEAAAPLIPDNKETTTTQTTSTTSLSNSLLIEQIMIASRILENIPSLQMKIIEENWKVVEPYLKVLQNDPTVNPSTSSFSQLTQAEQKYVHETFFELREELRSKGLQIDEAVKFCMNLKKRSSVVTHKPQSRLFTTGKNKKFSLSLDHKEALVEQLMHMTKELDKSTKLKLEKFKEGWKIFRMYLDPPNDPTKAIKVELSHSKVDEVKAMQLQFADFTNEMQKGSEMQKNNFIEGWDIMNEFLNAFEGREADNSKHYISDIEVYIAEQIKKFEKELRFTDMIAEKLIESWAVFKFYLESLKPNSTSSSNIPTFTLLTSQEEANVRELFRDFRRNARYSRDLQPDKLMDAWTVLDNFSQSFKSKNTRTLRTKSMDTQTNRFGTVNIQVGSEYLKLEPVVNIDEFSTRFAEIEESIQSKLEDLRLILNKGAKQRSSISFDYARRRSNRVFEMDKIEQSLLKAAKYLSSSRRAG